MILLRKLICFFWIRIFFQQSCEDWQKFYKKKKKIYPLLASFSERTLLPTPSPFPAQHSHPGVLYQQGYANNGLHLKYDEPEPIARGGGGDEEEKRGAETNKYVISASSISPDPLAGQSCNNFNPE